MQKPILATLLAILLLAPQLGLQAAGNQQYLQGKPFRDLDERIANINTKIEALKLQIGDLPPDLAGALVDLRLTVDDNSSDISWALKEIIDITIEIDSIIARILALEQSGPEPPDAERLVFSGHFIQGITPAKDSQLVQDWLDFRRNASGDFTSIEIRGSTGGGVSCSDPDTATAIANALSVGVNAEHNCENRVWNVGTAGNGIELNAGSIIGTNNCREEAGVRPLAGNLNWGGIGFTCNAPSQTLEVILTR